MNRQVNKQGRSRRPWAVWALLAATTAVCAEQACGEVAGDALRDARRRKIAEMSEAERARLQNNLKRFKDLDFKKQQQLRQLEQDLREDDRKGGGLRQVMKAYVDWLPTLDNPGQLNDLRRETDPVKRNMMVAQLVKEQHAEEETQAANAARRAGFAAVELNAIMAAVEKYLRNKEPAFVAKLDDNLKDKPKVWKHVELFRHVFLRPGPAGNFVVTPQQEFSQELAREMFERIRNPNQKNQPAGVFERGGFYGLFVRRIHTGIWSEIDKPNDDELGLFVARMPSAQQDEILRQPIEAQQRKFIQKYREAHPESYPQLPEIEDFGFGRFGRGNRGFGQRGGGGARGESEPNNEGRGRGGRRGAGGTGTKGKTGE
jgi:hypothetical protein